VAGQLWSVHLLTQDRELYTHAHIGAAKSGLTLHLFWTRYASLTDTSLLRKTMVLIPTHPPDFNVRACCGPDMINDFRSGGEVISGCTNYF
jgi:hypothetical protein